LGTTWFREHSALFREHLAWFREHSAWFEERQRIHISEVGVAPPVTVLEQFRHKTWTHLSQQMNDLYSNDLNYFELDSYKFEINQRILLN
jgi:hypothetical protein